MEITKWEYKEIMGSDTMALKELGKLGWEAYGTQPSNCHILLKRPCGIIKVEQQITGVRKEELPDFDLDRL